MLKEIAVKLRSMQLAYQAMHNLSKGSNFYADHEALSGYYDAVSADYDMVIERAINTEGQEVADLKPQLKAIYNEIKDLKCEVSSNDEFFQQAIKMEKELCAKIESHIKSGCSAGVEQLIGDIANKSEGRQYLINRRLK